MKYKECIDACVQCITDCEKCIAAMMGKPSHNDSPACCRECIEICRLCVGAMERESPYVQQYCNICAEVCRWCAEQCKDHEHDHCKKCAGSSEACMNACYNLVNQASGVARSRVLN